jgi:electron transport complex protein RnfD
MSKPKEYSWMTKDKFMLYTFVALVILAAVSVIAFGIDSIIISVIAVLVAVGLDYLLFKVTVDSPLNTLSAAVFGLIVALSYSLGNPSIATEAAPTLTGYEQYLFPAIISAVGLVLFKKIQGLFGRKYVNPAAAAKLLVLIFMLSPALMPFDHTMFSLTSSTSLGAPDFFGFNVLACYSNRTGLLAADFTPNFTFNDVLYSLTVLKVHGWVGGVSSIAVIAVGIAFFILCRKYVKWRITVAYLAATALFALALGLYYGGDPLLRVAFHLFLGSSIFLAFFMATDPATTPLTHLGQLIFGVGLAILTILIQTYMGFLGGSILALIIMNLTSPFLDKVGILKPTATKIEPKLPKAKQFTTTKLYECIRCGACMVSCCHRLSPILVKQAFDKNNIATMKKLQANLCEGCGHCTFVCPARIDLRNTMLRAKSALRTQ